MNQELINKYLKGEALPQERIEILEWIEESAENRKLFMQLRRIYDASIWNTINTSEEVENYSNNKKSFYISFVKPLMKAAAIFALAIIGTLYFQKSNVKSDAIFTQEIQVPAGQHVNITLSDGTKIALNSNTKLKFPSTFDKNKRTVQLDGEGYFEVAHNAKRPFNVLTNKHNIEVLGTTFNVLAFNNSDIFETSLLEGSVRIVNTLTSCQLILKPNEKVQLKNKSLVVTDLESRDDFLWREGIYVFKNEAYTEVFKKLEQYYQVKISVNNNQIHKFRCTGKFRQKEGISHVLDILKNSNNFEYKRDEKNNRIYIY